MNEVRCAAESSAEDAVGGQVGFEDAHAEAGGALLEVEEESGDVDAHCFVIGAVLDFGEVCGRQGGFLVDG